MPRRLSRSLGRAYWVAAVVSMGLALASCGGGGTQQDSGINKTYLSIEATDPDGDALQYQWRVTAGTVENKNARETVWTMPDGPGVHFAYVVVSDGKGGYVEQQYAVSTDALETSAPARPDREYAAAARTDGSSTARLRFVYSATSTTFGGTVSRFVYMPDMQVQVQDPSGATVFSGTTDLSGEISLPALPVLASNSSYKVLCATTAASAFVECMTDLKVGEFRKMTAFEPVDEKLGVDRNLRLYGHVAFKDPDGGVCGIQNDFFGLQKAATVQLLQADGTELTPPKRVNRFGDYALDAAVPVDGELLLQVECEGYKPAALKVPKPTGGFLGGAPFELSHSIDNQRPRVVKMVATGPNGNVRGRMIVVEAGAQSNGLPGPDQFLAYKGKDTALSACKYYESLGAVESCDAQGRMTNPISFADWKRKHGFGLGKDVSANYINKMDLNLVRRMVATQASTDSIAFYVCNNPGPEGRSQAEVDELLSLALVGEREVACVAMEWSSSPGVNGGNPFTKFLTFGPDGSLIPSVNLDGRGEKYMPGTCVACHGGSKYNGRFPETGQPSPDIGSRFLPFDLENYLFGTAHNLTRAAQNDALWELNKLVMATEKYYPADDSATTTLIKGWYPSGSAFNSDYAGEAWKTTEDKLFYREVIGAACRTCHISLGKTFDWDKSKPTGDVKSHVCGGGRDIALNASMPNALISRDRVIERVQASGDLAQLWNKYFQCDSVTPAQDPAFVRR